MRGAGLLLFLAPIAWVVCGCGRAAPGREEIAGLSEAMLSADGAGAEAAAERLSTLAMQYGAEAVEPDSKVRGWLEELAIPAFVWGLEHGSVKMRIASAYGVMSLAPSGEAAVPGLAKALDADDERLLLTAMGALGRYGARARCAEGRLGVLLGHPEMVVAYGAAAALARIGSTGVLLKALKSAEKGERLAGLRGIGEMGAGGSEVIARVVELCVEGDADVRLSAVQTLIAIGAGNHAAIQTLTERGKQDSASVVRQFAVEGLGLIGREDPAVPGELCVWLRDHDARVRAAAARGLGNLGVGGRQVFDLLRQIEEDPSEEEEVRSAARNAAKRMVREGR